MAAKRRGMMAAGVLLLVAVAAGLFYLHLRPVVLRGEVVLAALDGTPAPLGGADVQVFNREDLLAVLRVKLPPAEEAARAVDEELLLAQERLDEALRDRDFAARVLGVAERSNSPDLDACRSQHRDAETAVQRAHERLAQLGQKRDGILEPGAILSGLPSPRARMVTDAGGRFALDSRAGDRPVIVVIARAGEFSRTPQAWLVEADREMLAGGVRRFSNDNILTAKALSAWVGQ